MWWWFVMGFLATHVHVLQEQHFQTSMIVFVVVVVKPLVWLAQGIP